MKRLSILLSAVTSLILLLLVTSCGEKKPSVRFSPYSVTQTDLITDSAGVKSVAETTVVRDLSNGSKTTYRQNSEFDTNGNLTSRVDPDDDSNSLYLVYDEKGRVTDRSGLSGYRAVYNEFGDLVREEHKFDGDTTTYAYIYEYDDHGNLTMSGEEDTCTDNVEFQYGENGKILKTTSYGEGETFITDYNDHGFPEKTVIESDYGSEGPVTYEYEYDDYGNWVKRTEYTKIAGFRKPRKTQETTRVIEYYDATYAAVAAASAVVAPERPSSGPGNFISNYLDDLSWRWKYSAYSSGASSVMVIILLILTIAVAAAGLWWIIKEGKFPGFSGTRDEHGMKRLWMYNWQPYASAGIIMGDIAAAFIVSIIAMLLFGVIVWCFFGLIKLALMALLVVGYILLIIGILGVLAKEGFGCLGVLIGGAIVMAEDWMKRTGDQFLAWGNEFMETVNMIQFGYKFVTEFWDAILLVIFTPIIIFLSIALLFIILSGILMGIEWIITRIYSIHRPCPECSNTREFVYEINGRTHPVPLHPGLYGVFYQTRYQPYNTNCQYRVPTMLLNGRGRLDRRCVACGAMISATGQHAVGTDVHIGFVGHVEAGKSYLIYGGLGQLLEKFPDRVEQVNSGHNESLDIASRSRQISLGRSFKTDKRSSYRAVEVMIEVSGRPVPYHVHFYDVAGEQFAGSSATSATDTAAMKFYSSVKSIVLVIDPLQLDLTAPGMTPSAEFERWQSEHNRSSKRYNIADIFSSLEGYLNHYGRSGSLKDIDVSIVVVKSDLGFFEALNYPADPQDGDVESFVNRELGLQSLINTARKFRSVSFFATSAVSDNKDQLNTFFIKLLRQRGINLQ